MTTKRLTAPTLVRKSYQPRRLWSFAAITGKFLDDLREDDRRPLLPRPEQLELVPPTTTHEHAH